VWYVAVDAPTGGDGTTWQSAFDTLAKAIAAASEGDEIWIKAGTYLLENQVSVNKAVDFFAGFAGTETFRHQRDWENRQVIFDGQKSARCLFITSDARLDGITFQNGALPASYINGFNGGALIITDSSPILANCVFINNHISGYGTCSGGAVYTNNSSARFENCRFEGNNSICENGSTGRIIGISDVPQKFAGFDGCCATIDLNPSPLPYIAPGTVIDKTALCNSGGAVRKGDRAASTILANRVIAFETAVFKTR